MKGRSAPRAAVGIALLALTTVPFWVGNSYYIDVASQILLFAVFALALNVLVGYAGLVSLGHAGLFAVSGYTAALMLQAGFAHAAAAAGAVLATLLTSAAFAVLALRATGIGFLMITLALGQILWGIAYRWVDLTNGDNGVSISTRPAPFGISLAGAPSFYYATLVIFFLALAAMAALERSPFGASLRGTRDQARRMTALGYNVWVIRFLAFLFSGLWCSIAGLLYLYNKQFVSPQASALQASAEVLLMVISGGTATLLGPVAGAAIVVIMKYVVSAYVVRWNLVLGVIFVAIISFMPEGLVPGSLRIWGFVRRRWLAHRANNSPEQRRFFSLPRLRGRGGEGGSPPARGLWRGPLPAPPPQAGEGKGSIKPTPGASP
jgi:branched-chain amino acid transport system permease protein